MPMKMFDEMIDDQTEEKTYTETDMKEFAEWLLKKEWIFHPFDNYWFRKGIAGVLTTDELLKKWREGK